MACSKIDTNLTEGAQGKASKVSILYLVSRKRAADPSLGFFRGLGFLHHSLQGLTKMNGRAGVDF